MNAKSLLLCLGCVIIIAASAQTAHSDVVRLDIKEDGQVFEYGKWYVTHVEGTMSITNPYANPLYFVSVPFNLPTGLTIEENGGTHYICDAAGVCRDSVIFLMIKPLSTATVRYTIKGYPTTFPRLGNHSIFFSALSIDQVQVSTSIIAKLIKGQIELEAYTGKDRRLIIVSLKNPANRSYNITKLQVIKTNQMDPNTAMNRWVFANLSHPLQLPGNASWKADIVDYGPVEGEIYWLTYDIESLRYNFTDSSDLNTYFKKNITSQQEGAGGAPPADYEQEILRELPQGAEIFLRKIISKKQLLFGDIVNVSVIVNNLDVVTRQIYLKDFIPSGFEILTISDEGKTTDNRSINWNSVWVNARSARIFHTLLRYIDETGVGVDYFMGAEATFEGNTVKSPTIAFIRNYLPEKKAYIQKRVSFLPQDEVLITLTIQNLGEAELSGLLLKEYLKDEDLFREISEPPESKGVWAVPVLTKGQSWQLTYITDENERINYLPQIFGIDMNSVLMTLIVDNMVKYNAFFSAISWIEIIGLILVVVIPVIYFILHRRDKEYLNIKARGITKDIHHLKQKSAVNTDDEIKKLLTESRRYKQEAKERKGQEKDVMQVLRELKEKSK